SLSPLSLHDALPILEYFIRRHQQAGDVETVLPIVTDTSRLRPRNGWLRHRLVDLLLDVGRTEDAIRELDTLGEIQLSAGQKRERSEEHTSELQSHLK